MAPTPAMPNPPAPRPALSASTILLAVGVLGLLSVATVVRWQRPLDRATGLEQDAAYRVDLNRADAAQLSLLPNVGPALARRIVEYRRQHGPFQDVDHLRGVPGIGAARLEAIRPLVVCGSAPTRPATAPATLEAELETPE